MVKQAVINNLLISYSEAQGGGNQALLFLHGWRSQKEVWQPIIQRLSVINYQVSVFALDLPGFGGSQQPLPNPPLKRGGDLRGFTVGDYANVVAGFIRKLDLKNVTVIGHSFGGRVAIKLSSANPELVSKLVLADSAGFAMPSSKKKLMATAAKIVKPFFKPQIMRGLRKKIYQTIGAEDYLATPELQQTFVNVTSEDLSADMKNIKCPTLIISGENDTDTPIEFGQRMKFQIPNSKFQILKSAGHFSFLDRPEEFVKVLTGFVVQALGLPFNE